jgi:hypothetical protein
MPAADTQQRRAGLALLPGLLWAGVGLAPVAALLVLFSGDSTALVRVAVLLAVVAVVLIGVSMALRRDPDVVRDQVEEMIFEELDVLRDDLREDITTAARATHKALGERVVKLHESVEVLRGQFDNLRVQVERGPVPAQPVAPATPPPPPPPPPPVTPPPSVAPPPHGMVRHTETVKVTTRQTIVDQNDGGRGTVYGSSRGSEPVAVPAQRRASSAPPRDDADEGESWTEQLLRQRLGPERFVDGGFGADRRDEPRYDKPRYDEPRYDEPRYDQPRYDEGRYDQPRYDQPRFDEPRYDEGRYDQPRYDEPRYDQPRYGDDRIGDDERAGERLGGRRRAPEAGEEDGERITGVRAGDRWAGVRSDDRGREVWMGERRAAMQADDSGTEVRIEDRWAAVRREEARRSEVRRDTDRDRDGDRDRGRERGGRGDASWAEARYEELRADDQGRWRERRPGQPALPATSSEPSASSWVEGWSARPEPVSDRIRRSRHGDDDGYRWDDRDEDTAPPRSARARSAEYDTGEERWR